MRLPTAVFPGQPLSLPILHDNPEHRPLSGAISPNLVEESSGGQIALLADGARHGVLVDVPHSPQTLDVGALLHVMGGQRVELISTGDRTPAGGRLASFGLVDDEDVSAPRAFVDETNAAHVLLKQRVREPTQHEWPLTLCTLYPDSNILPITADPTAHPEWRSSGTTPEGASDLTFWLACRLPLTTTLRLHVLSTTCPLQRMCDLVACMRLLRHPERQYRQSRGPEGSQLRVLWREPGSLPPMVIELGWHDREENTPVLPGAPRLEDS